MTFLYILLAIVILLFMVLIHEFGHYVAGKILKFKITEFSVGFGFPIFSKTSKKTGEKFSLRIFPLGGYCAFEGEDEDLNSPTAFNNQKPWKRIIVFFAGVTANFITAIIFSWILLCVSGYDVPQIAQLNENPMYEQVYEVNDLQVGDVITQIAGTEVDFAFGKNYANLIDEQRAKAEEFYKTEGLEGNKYAFIMGIRRGDTRMNLTITVLPVEVVETADDNTQKTVIYYLTGLESGEKEPPVTKAYVYGAWEGFCRSFEMAFGFAWVVLKNLWQLITFQIPITEIGGTITTISMIATYASQSLNYLLIFIPLIAANLAIFNILPFPALDGSHVLFTLIEWIRGKPINRKVEGIIHTVGICILLAFVVIVDIIHFCI